MKTYIDCIPCFFKQAIEAARLAGAGKKAQKKVIAEVARILPDFPLNLPPPIMGKMIYAAVEKVTRKSDSYQKIKQKSNRMALAVYPKLKKKVKKSSDPLLTAVELAIAGNIIDYGVKNSLNIEKELEKILSEEEKAVKKENKAVFDYTHFKKELRKAKTILYLGDNAGEIVFDRILLEEIKCRFPEKEITFAVRGRPIINDALAGDAYFCGIDKLARVVSSGSDAPGAVLSLCSPQFLRLYRSADMVISKGQGNFEALSKARRAIFFLFMAKCEVIANHVSYQIKSSRSCRVGDIILFYHHIEKEGKTAAS